MERRKDKEIIHPTVHFPDDCNNQHCARAKPGVAPGSPSCALGDPSNPSLFCCFFKTNNLKLRYELSPIMNTFIAGDGFICYNKITTSKNIFLLSVHVAGIVAYREQCCLPCSHPMWAPILVWLLHFWSCSLLMPLAKQRMMVQVLEPVNPYESQKNPLASVQLRQAIVAIGGVRQKKK